MGEIVNFKLLAEFQDSLKRRISVLMKTIFLWVNLLINSKSKHYRLHCRLCATYRETFQILTPKSPLCWVSKSFRQDICQFDSPQVIFANRRIIFHQGKLPHCMLDMEQDCNLESFLLLKMYLLWKIWPILVKQWKPVWIRAWTDDRKIALKFHLMTTQAKKGREFPSFT